MGDEVKMSRLNRQWRFEIPDGKKLRAKILIIFTVEIIYGHVMLRYQVFKNVRNFYHKSHKSSNPDSNWSDFLET